MFPVCCVQTDIEFYTCGDDSEQDKIEGGGGGDVWVGVGSLLDGCFSGYLFLHSILKAYRDMYAIIPFSWGCIN